MIGHASVSRDVSLAPFTTYKVGGPASWFAEPQDLEELRSILALVPKDMDIVILGRGSNVIISDGGIDGLVLRLGGAFGAIDTGGPDRVVAGGGASLPKVARAAASAGKAGLGFYVGIPGSVGGAIVMNAGGHGSDTATVLDAVIVLELRTGSLTKRGAGALELSYRHSNLTASDVVVQATFVTAPGDPEVLEQELRSITRWRKEHQPGGTLNAGSVFKNPVGEAAGQIIEACGLKGTSVGPVAVSDVHANFLVASREATAEDLHGFVYEIQSKVLGLTGIKLEPEIRFLGPFTSDGADL
jgi:UDP-N-acetylmuramate dehydrogenase